MIIIILKFLSLCSDTLNLVFTRSRPHCIVLWSGWLVVMAIDTYFESRVSFSDLRRWWCLWMEEKDTQDFVWIVHRVTGWDCVDRKEIVVCNFPVFVMDLQYIKQMLKIGCHSNNTISWNNSLSTCNCFLGAGISTSLINKPAVGTHTGSIDKDITFVHWWQALIDVRPGKIYCACYIPYCYNVLRVIFFCETLRELIASQI